MVDIKVNSDTETISLKNNSLKRKITSALSLSLKLKYKLSIQERRIINILEIVRTTFQVALADWQRNWHTDTSKCGYTFTHRCCFLKCNIDYFPFKTDLVDAQLAWESTDIISEIRSTSRPNNRIYRTCGSVRSWRKLQLFQEVGYARR